MQPLHDCPPQIETEAFRSGSWGGSGLKEGLANARAKGKRLGRPPALNERQTEQARRMVDSGMSLRFVAGASASL